MLLLCADHPPGPGGQEHPRGPQQELQDLRLWPLAQPPRPRGRDVRAEEQGRSAHQVKLPVGRLEPVRLEIRKVPLSYTEVREIKPCNTG